ncbi:MAG: UDP-2,4-diacetamido-2,4,6-trideoxy-beta-L-altropyranose hydrolase [Paenibacillaceae bacterium]
MINIYIRADSSYLIGSGHVMRCLALAHQLAERGASIQFICRELEGNMISYIEQAGFPTLRLPVILQATDRIDSDQTQFFCDIDWRDTLLYALNRAKEIDLLIIDHYEIDYRWEQQARLYTQRIMVIDDLADRRHDCDVLLDQNLYDNMEQRYKDLIPEHCLTFLGPSHVLLRKEFTQALINVRNRSGNVEHILVFYGGSDPTNETLKSLNVLQRLQYSDLHIHVVVGTSNRNKEAIEQLCTSMNHTYYYCQIDNMAEMIVKADLCLGAGGSATWERCLLGLPTIVTITASNQAGLTETVAKYGAIRNMGWHQEVNEQQLYETVQALVDSPEQLRYMTQQAQQIMPRAHFLSEVPLVNAIMRG